MTYPSHPDDDLPSPSDFSQELEESMSKFESIVAEAAWAIHNNGFAEDSFGDSSEGSGHYAFVVVSPRTLRDIGEDELANEFQKSPEWNVETHGMRHFTTDMPMGVVVMERTDGFVTVLDQGILSSVRLYWEQLTDTDDDEGDDMVYELDPLDEQESILNGE